MEIQRDKPLLIGHRGVPGVAPENTMTSFRAALDAGLDGIEIDVHRTRDGVLAVHHDPVTADGVDLAQVDWQELQTHHPEISRLEDVFELMEGYADRYLNIELKSRFPFSDGREQSLAVALESWTHEAASRAWISCFDPLALVKLQRLGVEASLALLVWQEDGLEIPDLIPALEISGLHVEQRVTTTERVERWHAAGLYVFAWTVNSAVAARQLAGAGVDGLIGDYPERLREAVR